MNFEQARFNMVEQQIRPWEVLDQRVLDVISATPREYFVPKDYQGVAYSDTRIPIGHGETMLAPKVEGRILQALAITARDRGLLIGTGTGFLAALMAQLAGQLTSIDIHDEFTQEAARKLTAFGLHNVSFATQDGCDGYAQAEPFDFIAASGAMANFRPLIQQQLAIGGRLFLVLGNSPIMNAHLITRETADVFTDDILFETDLKYLAGAEATRKFDF